MSEEQSEVMVEMRNVYLMGIGYHSAALARLQNQLMVSELLTFSSAPRDLHFLSGHRKEEGGQRLVTHANLSICRPPERTATTSSLWPTLLSRVLLLHCQTANQGLPQHPHLHSLFSLP